MPAAAIASYDFIEFMAFDYIVGRSQSHFMRLITCFQIDPENTEKSAQCQKSQHEMLRLDVCHVAFTAVQYAADTEDSSLQPNS